MRAGGRAQQLRVFPSILLGCLPLLVTPSLGDLVPSASAGTGAQMHRASCRLIPIQIMQNTILKKVGWLSE